MLRVFIVAIGLIACLGICGSAECEEKGSMPSSEISYRQREFYSSLKYLNEKEQKIAGELNEEVTSHNQNPSTVTLQRVEDLKIKIVENLQDQIRSDREYIAYLERKLADMLNSNFRAFTVVDDSAKIKQTAEAMMEKVEPQKPSEEKTVIAPESMNTADDTQAPYSPQGN